MNLFCSKYIYAIFGKHPVSPEIILQIDLDQITINCEKEYYQDVDQAIRLFRGIHPRTGRAYAYA